MLAYFFHPQEHVPFGEVAHAPPRLQFSEKLLKRKQKENKLGSGSHPGPSKHQQEQMDAMRKRAVEQYRLLKVRQTFVEHLTEYFISRLSSSDPKCPSCREGSTEGRINQYASSTNLIRCVA